MLVNEIIRVISSGLSLRSLSRSIFIAGTYLSRKLNLTSQRGGTETEGNEYYHFKISKAETEESLNKLTFLDLEL